MKRTYKNPEIKISVFCTDNIVTTSGETQTTAAGYMEQNADKVFGTENKNKARTIIIF